MKNKDFWQAVTDLSPRLFKSYAVIEKMADNEVGYCYGGNDYLGEKIGKNSTNMSRDISELKKLGYIWTIEIKFKGEVVSRRIYTETSYKRYLDDLDNYKNLGISFSINMGTEAEPDIVIFNETNMADLPKEKFMKLPKDFRRKLTEFYRVLESIENSEIAENGKRDIAENSKGGIAENGKVYSLNITSLNITEKQEEPVSDFSKSENKIKLACNLQNISFEESFIKELTAYPMRELLECISQIPKGQENSQQYLIGIIKNKKLNKISKKSEEKIEMAEKIENQDQTKKMERQEFIDSYLDGKSIDSLDPTTKGILNSTLRRMGYEQLS